MPVMLALMQLAVTSSSSWLRLELKWRPRLENQPADDLTNENFTKFDLSNRIVISWNQLEFSLLESLAKLKDDFEMELHRHRLAKREAELSLPGPSKKRRCEKSSW
jgi:hypothetical protein